MTERLGVVVDCALDVYSSQCQSFPDIEFMLPERIGKPMYFGNFGFQVTLWFVGDSRFGVVIHLTWDDIDEYIKRLAEKHRNEAS